MTETEDTKTPEFQPPEPEMQVMTPEQIAAAEKRLMADEGGPQDAMAKGRSLSLASEAGPIGPYVPQDTLELKRLVMLIVKGGVVPKGFTFPSGPYKGEPDTAKMAVAILAGREVGYGPMMSLRSIMVVNGLASVWGAGAKALVASKNVVASDRRYWIDVDSETRTPRRAATPEAVRGLEVQSDKLRADGFIQLYADDEEIIWAKPMKIPAANIATADWPLQFGRLVIMQRRGVDGHYIGRFSVGDARRAKLWDSPKKLYGQYPADMLDARAWARAANSGFADCLMGLAIRELLDEREDSKPQLVADSFLDEAPATPEPAQGASS